MKYSAILVAFCVFGLVSAGKVKQISKRLDLDGYEHKIVVGHHSEHGGSGKGGYISGSGLRSIAQGSANQAHSAVTNQLAAGVQASYVAQNTLAQSAIQAAATAQAALAGKEVLLLGLQQQSQEAQQDVEAELAQLHLAEQSVAASRQAAAQAQAHVSILSSALNSAQGVAEHAQQAVAEATAELASQTAMVAKAKERIAASGGQLNSALADYEATKQAAERASAAAQEAQSNAAAAAAHAHQGLHENAAQHSAAGQSHHDFTSSDFHGHHH